MSMITETKYGLIEVTDNVIANIAGCVATRCYGVVGMTQRGTRDGIVNLLKKENMSKGIRVIQKDGAVSLELHIMVEHGVNIAAIGENISSTVSYMIEEMTGIIPKEVQVCVDGIRVD